jgi:gliding motility-associated-like protein
MKHLYPFMLLIFLQTPGFAKHIIGGVLTYECLGGGNYRFTMKMYRDCSDPTGAGFDNNAPFSIYKGNTLLTTTFVSPSSITSINPPANPCVQLPPNVCVQEGIYTFDYHFTDWPSTQSYHVSYQRCCRNATVTNIQNPGDVGATFTVEILPASQAVCNNSPVYDAFPPTVICVNQPLTYNHSAVDAEGDQLVYELCSPLLGGGQGGLGGGNPTGCNGITPNPACPPPYQPANFINPPYSPLNPMGGNPAVTINPVTGVLTGTPITMGQFVVAICISEYRNGQLLSVVRRDFQFNVANCEQVVDADLMSPGLTVDGGNYYIKTCDDLNIVIENTSSNPQNVNEVKWEFEVDDSTWVFDTWDVNLTFPETGLYEGKLRLNPSTQCSDSALIFIEIFPELVASFGYDYDTCVSGPVNFIDQSFIDGPGDIAKWQWNLDNGVIDTLLKNPVHIYDEPKTVPVKLQIWDTHGCSDDTVRAVVYKPVPALILVKPNDTVSCPPAEVFFNNLSNPVDQTYQINWDFGDGGTSGDISPTHVYRSEGTYDVRLEITSPIGCYTDTLFEKLVEIQAPPIAGFNFDPANPSNFNPEVNFFDQSANAVHWDWYLNGRLIAQQPDFTYSMPDTGIQEITLIITHPEKCQDTLTQYVDVEPKVTFFLPNAFTPNEDTVNDYFQGTGITRGVTNFRMEIWNRFGDLVYETTDIEEPWNGRVNNSGRFAQNGVYICVVTFTEPRGKRFEHRGYATLLR